ncbi:MAG: hypothetical protein ABI310_11085 [Microbacteriaceae bacterium]
MELATPGFAPQRAIVAFAVAAVGFIFACVPGALVLGWVLLPIGFILAIVALFFKEQSKGFALTALIVAVVGTVVGFVVFFAFVANSFNDSFGGTSSGVIQTDGAKATDQAKDAGSSKLGTRENPAALGSIITGQKFTVEINSVNLNATDAVLAVNEFNDAPADGKAYALINATVTYTDSESGSASEFQIAYVTSTPCIPSSRDAR